MAPLGSDVNKSVPGLALDRTIRAPIECLYEDAECLNRAPAGNARCPDPEGPRPRTDARPRDLKKDRAGHQWHVSGKARFAVSGAAPHGGSRVAFSGLGRV